MPRKRIFGYVSFIIMILGIVLGIKLLNWFPRAAESRLMRQYEAVEEVQKKLNFQKIYVPHYFPQTFRWPPSRIFAQGTPYKAVIMEFNHLEKGDPALIITEADSPEFAQGELIKLSDIKERAPYDLKGRKALLEVGSCRGQEPCARISWSEGGYEIRVVSKSPAVELVKIAESMVD